CLLRYYCHRVHRDLHSFPTRRSSDLKIVHRLKGDVDAQVTFAGERIGNAEGDPRLHRLHAVVKIVDVDFQELAIGDWGKFLSWLDRKSTRLNSSHVKISYAVFCLKKK